MHQSALDSGATSTQSAHSGVRFATADERDTASVELGRGAMVVVELEGIGPSARGRLAEVIDEAVERCLAARGAATPGITSGSDRDATLSDQMFRARRAGATGIAIMLGPLRAATGFKGSLEPEDAATLRFLAEATRERPLVLVLDACDIATGAYGDPVTLQSLLVPAPAAIASGAATETATETATATPTETSTETATETETTIDADSESDAEPEVAAKHTAGASVVEREERWRACTLQLAAARGPQPLAVLERLFAEAYMPLANALARGLDDPRARHAHDEFATTFSRGYSEAFATFASTTKRPRMVFDAHDVAAKIGRLHGARSTRILVVDAMRWDLARLVEERLVAKLGSKASLTDELLLWSALPTTTLRQLETIARGIEALRIPASLDAEPEPPRGRTAEYVRRMRVGPREIHKLDVIESRLQSARGRIVQELPEMAEDAAEAIARHADTLAPRTLLFVTGDHGFAVDRTGVARQGGASPEEVLVGAFALLVGDVH